MPCLRALWLKFRVPKIFQQQSASFRYSAVSAEGYYWWPELLQERILQPKQLWIGYLQKGWNFWRHNQGISCKMIIDVDFKHIREPRIVRDGRRKSIIPLEVMKQHWRQHITNVEGYTLVTSSPGLNISKFIKTISCFLFITRSPRIHLPNRGTNNYPPSSKWFNFCNCPPRFIHCSRP